MIPGSLTKFRIGVARIDGQWRIVSQANNEDCIIYDPPCADKEDAIRLANLISDTYRQSLRDNGIKHWKVA